MRGDLHPPGPTLLRRVRRWPAVLGVVVVLVAGCTPDLSTGTPQPNQDSTAGGSRHVMESTSAAGGPLTGLDPCRLITTAQARELGTGHGEPTEATTSRGCLWVVAATHGFGISLYDATGSADLHFGGQRSPVTVHGRPAERIAETAGPGTCSLVLPITTHSVTTINVRGVFDTTTACQHAEHIADLIAPKLPTTNNTSTGSSPGRPLLRDLEPCAVLDPAAARELGAVDQGTRADQPGSRQCTWTVLTPHHVYIVGVALFDTTGRDDLTLTGNRTPVTIAGRHADRIEHHTHPAGCDVVIPITDTATAVASVTGDLDTATACQIAEQVTTIIAPRLP
ncbi:MAG: DUF3558 family protein [Gammaproteobacteria bacterium]